MIELQEEKQSQILLIAPEPLAEALANQLNSQNDSLKTLLSKENLSRHPNLVIWYIDNPDLPRSIELELNRLQERWDPSPILILLPENSRLNTTELLEFNCAGLLQGPSLKVLSESISTLINGGRVVRLKDSTSNSSNSSKPILGLSQWLLVSGLQQINNDLDTINMLLDKPQSNPLLTIIILGRKRELKQAKSLLNFLWGPIQISVNPLIDKSKINNNIPNKYDIDINLKTKDPFTVWKEIYYQIENLLQDSLINSTGRLFALEALKPEYKKDLLKSLLHQLDHVIEKLSTQKDDNDNLYILWNGLQTELRQQSLRSLIGGYVRLPHNGEPIIVGDELISRADLIDEDEELPSSQILLQTLINNKPILVDGKYLPADNPRALIHLKLLIGNWLIRTAEIISAELISISAEWPEFRQYLLNKELISTRELERLRNQLNSQNQWQNIIQRPIRLYESKRLLYTLNTHYIESILVSEPRDEELRQLGWLQQQVALLIEARDAIAPQLQTLIKYIGDLMVVLLTRVIGRAIGLIGKGVAQGMGRTLKKG